MIKQARLGDPISHGGVIITASPDVKANGIAVARLTDQVMCAFHGVQTIVTASTDVTANNLGCARVGDLCSCGAVIMDGSPDVYTN
jgi:uncharacterized Zn-binding protein involved in type VI secretion